MNKVNRMMVLLTVMVIIFSFQLTAQAKDKIEWSFYAFVPTTNVMGKFFVDFAEKVKERTEGRLNITVRPVGELPYKATDSLRIVSHRNVEIADANNAYIAGESKIAAISSLPFLMTSQADVIKLWDIYYPPLANELKRKGVEVLFIYTWPEQHLWGSGKALTNLEDLKGRKIRSQNAEIAELLKRFGASTVTLSTSEVATAMQRGIAEGVITSGVSVYTSKWYEFLEWGYLVSTGIPLDLILVNSKAMAELPVEIRKILKETAKEWQDKMLMEVEELDKNCINKLEKEVGLKIVRPGKEAQSLGAKKLADFWMKWAKKQGPEVVELTKKIQDKLYH